MRWSWGPRQSGLAGSIARAFEAAGSRGPRDVAQMRLKSKAGQTTEDSTDTPWAGRKGFLFKETLGNSVRGMWPGGQRSGGNRSQGQGQGWTQWSKLRQVMGQSRGPLAVAMKARKEHGVSVPGSACPGWWVGNQGQRTEIGGAGWALTLGRQSLSPSPPWCAGSPLSPHLARHTYTHVITLTQGTLLLTHLHACPHSHTHVHSHLHAHMCSHISVTCTLIFTLSHTHAHIEPA